ncbi:MAG: hypothetical protein SNJ76_00470 [Fimbriimonadaceae bacterium]
MSLDDLFRLWQLHRIDEAIVEIRARAAALDPGRAIMAEIKGLEETHASLHEQASRLSGELQDLELRNKGIEAKLKKIDAEMYGGKVVNPREVEALEKEIESLKAQRAVTDERIMELWELVPAAKSKEEEARKAIDAKKAELAAYQKKVIAAKHQLEKAYRERQAERGPAAEKVPAAMLARYESTRQRTGGVGMAKISKTGSCGMCGTMLPEKLIEGAREGRLVACEGCHRFLYFSEGVV